MVHLYVYDVTHPFVWGSVRAGMNNVFVWRASGLIHLHDDGEQVTRWDLPPSATVLLMEFDMCLRCRDINPPMPSELVRIAVGEGPRVRQPSRPTSARPALVLLKP